MYCGDYDDTTPTINSRRGGNPAPVDIDYYVALYPYVKNMNVFLSPGRRSEYSSIGGSGDDCVDGFNTTNQCIGYGWNWGITSGAGSGLTYARSANGEPGYDPLWRTNVGKNFSQIEQTASMFAAGNTGDSPRFTICVNYVMQYYSNTKSSLFFNGKHNMAFLDGHAKSVAWTIGTMSITGSDVIALPAAKSDAYKYCDQPDSVDTRVGMTCRAYADLLYSVCVFDLSEGAVRVRAAPQLPNYWSIALYSANSDNFFVRNDRQAAGKPVDLWLVPSSGAPAQDRVPAGAEVVVSPSKTGFLLMRVLASDYQADQMMLEAARRTLRCEAARGP